MCDAFSPPLCTIWRILSLKVCLVVVKNGEIKNDREKLGGKCVSLGGGKENKMVVSNCSLQVTKTQSPQTREKPKRK